MRNDLPPFLISSLGETTDPVRLHRASSFPNLALLFSIRTYSILWAHQALDTTTNGWDHWLRIRVRSLDMDCIYPSLPRVRHRASAQSSTASRGLSKKLEQYPLESEGSVSLGDARYVVKEYYERSLVEMLMGENATKVKEWDEGMEGSTAEYPSEKDVLVLTVKDDLRRVSIMKNRIIVVPLVREVAVAFLCNL